MAPLRGQRLQRAADRRGRGRDHPGPLHRRRTGCRRERDRERRGGRPGRRLTEKPATKPLSGKYAKLRDDLRAALEAGRNAERENPEDGGTCNFDSVALSLPRWQAAKVEQAAKEAGTSCFSWDLFGGRRWVFGPDTRAQGNARTRNAEAMTRTLAGMGYQAMDYCQMD